MPSPQQATPRDLIVIFLFCVVLRAAATTYMSPAGGSQYVELAIQSANYLLLVVFCVFNFRLSRKRLRILIGPWPGSRGALAAVASGLVLLMFSLGWNAAETWTVAQFDTTTAYRLSNFHTSHLAYDPFWSTRVIAFVFVTVIMGPIAEEFFFRGLLLRALAVHRGFGSAAVLCSLGFTAMHFNKWQYSFDTFVFSMSLCYIYFLFRSLIACAIVHATFNLAAFLHQDYFDSHWTRSPAAISSIADWWPESAMLVLSIAAMGLAIVMCRRRLEKSLAPERTAFGI